SETGVIRRLQDRYARFLHWTLEHRGWAVTGIVVVSLLSVNPMKLAKGDGGEEQDPSEIGIYYQWHGAYSKEEMGAEVAKVERFINANRERFHVERIYSRYSEQGWARTEIDLDQKD